ncbi:MAG: aminoacyl-tRNA hydrolase [Rhodobiaceae bacterium]|jgi:PTH1 family peptidyl-tRNA hydrolase|nr:aminoacyl-tRNA hydrolase [Rhodobiaceae bacterium]MBT5517968.1 aminoacyl-tRNA hydrolase [Rhodobiaceae bacterium]MDG2495333.1 aminoacyl-tRNA hydrolase [Alphaproteobacteria bacterium]
MQLFIGLGNPEAKYAKNRHNIGFQVMDALAEAYSFGPFQDKFHGRVAQGLIPTSKGLEKTLLLKPQTFMNKSGVSVAEAVNFYKLDGSQILVFYDELDLPPGKLRMRRDGGLAGHNGLRSIKAHMGTDFRRARLGIGHPGHKDKVSGHVLGDFAKADQDWLAAFLKALCDNAPLAVEGEDATYQTRVVEAMKAVLPEPPKAAKPKQDETPEG